MQKLLNIKTFSENLRNELNFSYDDISHQFEIKKSNYVKFVEDKANIALSNVKTFAKRCHTDFDSIINGDADAFTSARRMQGDKIHIPLKFTRGAESKCRTLHIILDYIEMKSGKNFADKVLNYLQITPESIKDRNKKISIHLLNKTLELCELFDYQAEDFFQMGLSAFEHIKDTEVAHILGESKDNHDLFERFIYNEMPFFEANCHYKITSMNRQYCYVEAKSQPSVCKATGLLVLSSRELDYYKMGLISSMAQAVKQENFIVQKTFCEHRNQHTKFKVKYN